MAKEAGSTMMMAATLPLFNGRIVDFATIYKRCKGNNESMSDSLLDLSEELAGIASTQAERRAQEATRERLVYAPDQLAMLLTPKETIERDMALNEALLAKQQLAPVARARESTGKPLRRFQISSASPFVNALSVAGSSKPRSDDDKDRDDDALYVKVQQVAWEEDILWGIDFDAEKKQANDSVEEDESDDVSRSGSPSKASEAGHVIGYSKTTDVSAYKLMHPGRKSTVVERIPLKPQEEFDVTKPRHYRWEIPRSSAAASTSSSSSQGMTSTTAKGLAELPCPLNKELDDGSWIHAIGWNSTQEMPESKLVLDENDALLVLTVPGMDDIRPSLRIPERKLSAAEIRVQELEKRLRDKYKLLEDAKGKLNFGNGSATSRGPVGTEGSSKRRTQGSGVGKSISVVHHTLPAVKLSMTKPELSKAKLRAFHRPRSKFKINERMVFALPPVIPILTNDEGVPLTQIRKSSDLTPVAGGKLILVEFTEQNPPVVSNPGMASRLLHYWRPPDHEGDAQLGKKKPSPKAPDVKMGQVITLGRYDEPPFVGNVPPSRVVTSLNSQLYKVPIFEHKPVAPFAPSASARDRDSSPYELFLLCRAVAKGKNASAIGSDGAKTTLYIFEMPDVYLAGQVEPQIEVPAPNSRGANEFIRPYMALHILRLLKKASDRERLKIEDVARVFPHQSSTAIRKRMKEVAIFERGGNDSGWWRKKPASELKSEDEIRESIKPESVCLYESMMAGQRRLLDIGLTKLFTPTGVNGTIDLLLKRLELRKQVLSAALVEPLELERRAKKEALRDVWKRDLTVRKLETDIKVARFIHEQLLLTPWNLTNSYVECHLQGKGSGMLQLGGIGDPTGRGEGFSFVRERQSRAKKSEGEEEGADALTGTTADLRKLKMKEAGEVLRHLGVPEAEIKKLRRWDRIHLIRDLSNFATSHGRGGALRKFARGERKSLSAQQQDYQHRCDDIYERQLDVLSSTSVTFSDDEESGDEESGDDDSDIAELEDELLGAGSFGGEGRNSVVKLGPKNLFAKGGGGLNRSKEALAEREDAVELERLMKEMKEDSSSKDGNRRPDVDASKLRKQLRASGMEEGVTGAALQTEGSTRPGSSLATSYGGSNVASAMHTPIEHRSRASSPTSAPQWPSSRETPSRVPGRKVLKRTTRVVEEDGTESVRIEFIVDDTQVGRFLVKRQRQARQEKAGERNVLRKRMRMLVVEDDAPDSSQLGVAKRRKHLQDEHKKPQPVDVEMLE